MLAADLAPQPSKLVEKMTKTPVGLCPGAIKKGNKWTFKFKYYGKKDSPKDVLAKGLYDTKEAAESEIDLFRFAVHNYTLRKIYSVWQSYSDRSKGIPLTSAFIQLKDEFMAGKAKFLKLKTPNNVNASEKSIMEHAATICSLDPSDLEQHFTVREVLVHVDCTCKSSHCRNCGSNETMTSCTIADVLKSKGESRPLGRRRCNDDHWKTYAAMDIDEKARLAYKHAFNDLSKGKSAVVESEVVEYLDKLTIDQIDYQSVKLMKSGESDDVSTRISTQFSDAVRKVRARVYYRNDLLKKKEAEYQDALATTKRCETGDALILDNLSDVTDLVLEEVIGDRLTVAETLSDQERVCLYAVIRLMDGVVARQQEQKKSRHSKRSVREAVMSAKDLQKFLTGMALKLGEITHANDTIRRQCLQQVQSDFSPRNCLEFLDEDAKMSLNLWSKMRKLDNFSDDLLEISSRQDSMFASAYSITEEKKVFRKVIEDQLGFEFDASNPNVAFMTAEKIITLIVRATADYTNHTCEIRMSGDGKVQGGLNFTFWGFKLNDSQSADDYLICGVMCGSDNAENHDDFVQPYFKKVETICKKGTFTVDGIEFTLIYSVNGDHKFLWFVIGLGDSHNCCMCNDRCKCLSRLRPICDDCAKVFLNEKYCRCAPKMNTTMPDYNHVHIEWPDLENATLAELKVFLPNILRITLAPGSNLKAHKDAYSSWMSQNHVCLFGATEYDPAWIACASNERINAMLQVYFPESRILQGMLEGFGGDKRLLLKIVLLQEEWIHYAMRHAAKGDMYCDPADTCNDPLHFLIRCFNTLLRLLLQSVLDNTKIKVKKDKSAKVERVSTMFTNDIYALKNGACANLKITIEDDKVYMPSLSGARLKKITLDYIKNILHLIYSEEDLEDVEQANSYLNWMRLFELFINIDGLLRSHTPLSNYQYVDFLHYKREFSDLFIYMFNYEHIGTYFHNLFSSHITTMLNDNNRCLFKQEQQGVEQKNQRLGTFMNNQTCHGGGKTPTYMCEKILEYCGRQNLRWLNKQRNFSNPESEVSWLDALLNNAGSKNYKYTK